MNYTVESPCKKQCSIDLNEICIACKRTMEEICSWKNMTNEEKKQVITRIERETYD